MREQAMPAREMSPWAEPATAGPASPLKRIRVVDMLRGFALFGILATIPVAPEAEKR